MPVIRSTVPPTPWPPTMPEPDPNDPSGYGTIAKIVIGPGGLTGKALSPRRCGKDTRERLRENGDRWWQTGGYWWKPAA